MKLQELPVKGRDGISLYEFHLGVPEMKILLAMLNNTIMHTPRVIGTEPLLNRCRNMRRALHEALHGNKRAQHIKVTKNEQRMASDTLRNQL